MTRLFVAIAALLACLLAIAVILMLGLLAASQASAEECPPNPLSGLQQNRWTVTDPCANEEREDGWYHVVVLRRNAMQDAVRYYSHLIEPADYEQAGIE